jgi:hypothetical protein
MAKIIIEIEGTLGGTDVRLEDLIDQLESVKRALSYAEEHAAIDGKRRKVTYRVVNLHHSFATAEITPEPVDPTEDRSGAIIYEFSARLRQIERGNVPEDVPVEELDAYGEISPRPERPTVRRVNVSFDAPTILKGAPPIQVTRQFEEKVTALIGPEEIAWGTMTGYLDAVNLHERNVFYLWPRIGPKRIYSSFNRDIREDVRQALGHYVQAAGRVHYRRRSNLPHRMTSVNRVEILDAQQQAVRLSDLRGIAPDATGGMDTREFIDTYDDDWQ